MKKRGYRRQRYEEQKRIKRLIARKIFTIFIAISMAIFIGVRYVIGIDKSKEENSITQSQQAEERKIVNNEATNNKKNEVAKSETNKEDKSGMILVNRERELSQNYVPKDLVVANVKTNKKIFLENETSLMLKKLFEKANQEDISLILVSGYRSYSYQKQLYNDSLTKKGAQYTSKYVAKPGQSEHQTGLAADVTIQGYGDLTEAFGDTKAGKWLAKNAHEFGFILRYKKGKESITGYNYEPWHIRYVGVDVAKDIENRDITLEEYLKE